MSEVLEDTGWQDSGHGYMIRQTKFGKIKPFNLEKEMKNTWCMSMPDGKGNCINTGGHWVDGKMVEEWKEITKDPFHNILNKPNNQ